MKRFLIAAALTALSALAPIGAFATTYTYTFNVPVDVHEVGLPGAKLTLECTTGDTSFAGSHPQYANNSLVGGLDNTGSFTGTMQVVVQTIAPPHFYACWFLPMYDANGSLLAGSKQLPQNLLTGVNGKI